MAIGVTDGVHSIAEQCTRRSRMVRLGALVACMSSSRGAAVSACTLQCEGSGAENFDERDSVALFPTAGSCRV